MGTITEHYSTGFGKIVVWLISISEKWCIQISYWTIYFKNFLVNSYEDYKNVQYTSIILDLDETISYQLLYLWQMKHKSKKSTFVHQVRAMEKISLLWKWIPEGWKWHSFEDPVNLTLKFKRVLFDITIFICIHFVHL